MQKIRLMLILSILCIFIGSVKSEQLTVSLSIPGETGKLYIDHVKGSINVTGYDGEIVIVNSEVRNEHTSNTDGKWQKIAQQDLQLSATEKNNSISIVTNSQERIIDLNIQVPYNFDLYIDNIENGLVEVSQVWGELVIDNQNDGIILTNVYGPAIISTTDGKIEARFNEIPSELPMAFSTISGNIDLFLPEKSQASFKMKSEYGEIFTDFFLELSQRKIVTEKDKLTGLSKVSLEEWTYANITGGGPSITLKSHHGNIFIHSYKSRSYQSDE